MDVGRACLLWAGRTAPPGPHHAASPPVANALTSVVRRRVPPGGAWLRLRRGTVLSLRSGVPGAGAVHVRPPAGRLLLPPRGLGPERDRHLSPNGGPGDGAAARRGRQQHRRGHGLRAHVERRRRRRAVQVCRGGRGDTCSSSDAAFVCGGTCSRWRVHVAGCGGWQVFAVAQLGLLLLQGRAGPLPAVSLQLLAGYGCTPTRRQLMFDHVGPSR